MIFPARERGFTLAELIVVVGLVLILFAAALNSLLPLRGHAEAAAFHVTLGALQSATGLETSRRVLQGGLGSIEGMRGANPMDWLQVTPANYSGQSNANADQPQEPGSWVFASECACLIYRVHYPQYLENTHAEHIRLRVKVSTAADGSVESVMLEQLDAVKWNFEASELRRWFGAQE